MKKDKNTQDNKQKDTQLSEEKNGADAGLSNDGETCEGNTTYCGDDKSSEAGVDVEALKSQLEEKSQKCDEYYAMLQRSVAEFDNYKKRTVREKEALYSDAIGDAITAFLPVVDSIERALQSFDDNCEPTVKEGIELIKRQIDDSMKKLGVEEIKSVGEEFNPEFHNAVMHIEDDSLGSNMVVEEFQRGYKVKDHVIRHSMVKVAN